MEIDRQDFWDFQIELEHRHRYSTDPQYRREQNAIMNDGFTPQKAGNTFKPAPSGTHLARVVWLFNIGWQESKWNDEVKRQKKIVLGWELPNCKVTEGEYAGQPMIITKFYTFSYGDAANLRKDLANWRGKDLTPAEQDGGFNLASILDKPCQVTIVHKEANGKTYANVTAITSLPQGIEAPARIHDLLKYSVEAHDQTVFEKMPEWIQKKCNRPDVATTTESENPGAGDAGFAKNIEDYDDDIPF